MKIINVLWTGGWDSTFRILQLSDKEVIIQPLYLIDENRVSTKLELETIESLTAEILRLETTKCTINQLIIEFVSDVEPDSDITKSYNKIRKEYKSVSGRKLGDQYEWLARFSKKIKNIELGIEKSELITGIAAIFGELKKNRNEVTGEYITVNKEKSSQDLIHVFGNFHFPLLNISKLEMKQIAEERGFIDIMNKTWFCHNPINELPCGKCVPCMQVFAEGLGYRLGKKVLFKYRIKIIKEKLKKILR